MSKQIEHRYRDGKHSVRPIVRNIEISLSSGRIDIGINIENSRSYALAYKEVDSLSRRIAVCIKHSQRESVIPNSQTFEGISD